MEEAYLISKANRYDIKGRKYIAANLKYYFTDVGLRNARLNFRQQEYNSFRNIPDSFKKIVLINGIAKPWRNDEGYVIMGIKYFLLHGDSLNF